MRDTSPVGIGNGFIVGIAIQDVGIDGGRDDLLGEQATVVVGHGSDHAHAVFGLDHTACVCASAIESLLGRAVRIGGRNKPLGAVVGIGITL